MASKNSRLRTVRLMDFDLKAIEAIAKNTGKTQNAVMVAAIRKEIQSLNSSNREEVVNEN